MPKHDRRITWLSLAAVFLVLAFTLPKGERAQGLNNSFNGERAFADLKHIVDYGPRPAGSKSLADERKWIEAQLKETGAQVEEDAFKPSTPAGDLPMANIIAKFPGTQSHVIIVAGHYDTKRFSDFRFVGANDGGSSAALLLELARELKGRKHDLTYWLVFFDGEEAVRTEWEGDDNTYGSRHMVEKLSSNGQLGRIDAMILVDMIGDSHLIVRRNAESTGWLVNTVFNAAQRLGYSKYFPNQTMGTDDDHIPFVNAGVPSVDLIDFNPDDGYWHTAKDNLSHCSPESLAIVGNVVMASLADLDKAPKGR
jgi:glutaminyl-peptide cyclotransferase